MNQNQINVLSKDAVARFWVGRSRLPHEIANAEAKGAPSGVKPFNAANLLDGFFGIFSQVAEDAGIEELNIVPSNRGFLPSYFRPNKRWGSLYFLRNQLAAALEIRSIVGKSGLAQYAQRLEEALAMGFDFRVSAEQELFRQPFKPWSGLLLVVEDSDATERKKEVVEPHLSSLPELQPSSVIDRCSHFCQKVVEQEIFDSASIVLVKSTSIQLLTEPLEGHGLKDICDSFQESLEGFSEMIAAEDE